MKKSFLKRAMAAAIAVPVALTQTLLCASFAADTTEGTATDTTEAMGTLTVNTFVNVEANPNSNKPVEVSATDTTRVYKQNSVWNLAVMTALSSIPAGTVEALDVTALANKIGGDAWYTEAIKNAMLSEDAAATAEVNGDKVVITITGKYAYAADVQAMLDAKLGDVTVDLGNPTSDIKVVVTVDTSELAMGTTVKAEAEISVDGEVKDMAGLKDYAQDKLDEIRNATADAAQDDAALAADVEALFNNYQAKLDRADNIMATTKGGAYSGANFDEVLAAAKADYAGNAVADRVPGSLDELAANGTALSLATEALDQIGAITSKYGYNVDIAVEDVIGAAKLMSDVEAEYTLGGGSLYVAANATAPDVEVDEAMYATLEAYFAELEAEDGFDYVEGSLVTSKFMAVEANASVAAFAGDADLTVYRELTYEVVSVETTETTDTTESTETTDSSESTETTDSSESTETTDSSESTETTDSSESTETTDSSESTETTDSSESTETTDSTVSTETTDSTDSTETTDSTVSTETTESTESTEATTDTADPGSTVDPGSTETTVDSGSTETTETTETTESEPVVVKNVSAVAKTDNFYFSHDDSELTAAMLLDSAQLVVTTDGVDAAPVDVLANIQLGTTQDAPSAEAVTPAALYELDGNAYAYLPVYAFYVDPDDADAAPVLLDTEIYVYIGVKGDVTLTGEADANDAAKILVFAAEVGAGNANAKISTAADETLEKFAFFLGDTDLEGKDHNNDDLNANDAANVLRYAALEGALTEAPTIAQVKEFWDLILNVTIA